VKRLISYKLAGKSIILILILLIIFHLLILTGMLPYDWVWGGNVNTYQKLLNYELIAIIISVLFLIITIFKINSTNLPKFKIFINIGIWIMMVYFFLNLIGNLMSRSSLEKFLFTPIAIILVILIFRLVIEKE